MKNLSSYLKSISTELGILFLIIAMLPIFSTYFITNSIFTNSIQSESKQKLSEIAQSAHLRIESYVNSMIADVTTTAKMPIFKNVLLNNTELDAEFLEFLESFSLEKGYYDIILINKSGKIIFTLKKEEDLGLNIYEDPLKKSQLNKAIDSSNTLLQTEISNFAYYAPSKTNAAFLSAPIFYDGYILGNIVFQIDNQELYKIINRYSGLGKSGEIIVGTKIDGEFQITAPTRNIPDIHGKNLQNEGFETILKALDGEQGEGTYTDHRGKEVLGVWRYLPTLNWGMSVKTDTHELYKPIEHFRNITLSVALGSVLLVFLGVMLSKILISRPLVRLSKEVT